MKASRNQSRRIVEDAYHLKLPMTLIDQLAGVNHLGDLDESTADRIIRTLIAVSDQGVPDSPQHAADRYRESQNIKRDE
jgi:hypothetical protein